MAKNVFEPFDADVAQFGGYQYAMASRRSTVRANRRFSDVIVQTTNFSGRRVVDVGCGDGTYTVVLRSETAAASVTGIDPAGRAIERAQHKYASLSPGLSFRCGFASDLIRQGEHFDIAIYRGVIHHVGSPEREIADALKLADEVFFLEPNGSNPVLKLL